MKTKLVNWGYAPITTRSKNGYTYGEPVYPAAASAGGREYKADPSGDVKKIFANSQEVYVAQVNDGYEIELTLIDLIDTIGVAWLGYEQRSNGLLEVAKDTENPRFALLLSDNDTSDVGKTEIFYDCVVTERTSINGKTAEDGKWDEQFVTVKIKAGGRLDNKHVRFAVPGVAELEAVPEPAPVTP